MCPAVESISWSILGRRKLSFRQALFRSVKSTHIFHFLFAIFNHDNVGQPLRVIYFLDDVSGEQLVHFIHDCFVSFKSKNSSSLLDRLPLRIYIKKVLYDVRWYARHIFMAPSKYVQVNPQKANDFFICLGVKVRPYLDRLCWISFNQLNLL